MMNIYSASKPTSPTAVALDPAVYLTQHNRDISKVDASVVSLCHLIGSRRHYIYVPDLMEKSINTCTPATRLYTVMYRAAASSGIQIRKNSTLPPTPVSLPAAMGLLDWFSSNEKNKTDTEREGRPLPAQQKTGSWEQNLNAVDWSHYTSTQTITASAITTAAAFLLAHIYKTYIRRIPTVEYLKPSFLRRRSIYGYVSSVGDGDNFRLFHTPGGRMLGWSWFPGRQLKKMKKFNDKTIHVRIAGIDAPELAHFGRPAQPHSQEALDWLRSFVLHRYVRVYPYRKDQYDRVVCTAYKRRWLFLKSDVGEAMLKRGLATVYEAKFGSEFGGKEERYKAAEQTAKNKKIGIWEKQSFVGKMLGKSELNFESPREYKTRMASSDNATGKKR